MTNTLAWHNSPILKAEVLARMLEHRVEDSIVQGDYQRFAPKLATQYKGCLIGCTLPMGQLASKAYCCAECSDNEGTMYILQKDWHEEVEELYGLPVVLNHLLDGLFESLPASKAAWFAVSTIEAIPVGGDLSASIEEFSAELRTVTDFTSSQERRSPRWLKVAMNEDLEIDEDTDMYDERAVQLAEHLLECLANAPTPIPAPVVVPTPAPEEVKV